MQNLIEVESPQPSGYTIYSKSGCPNCTKAKNLVKHAHVIDCDEYLIEDKSTFLKYMDAYSKAEPRTFPIIFFNSEFVGGFTEVKIHYEKQQCFGDEF
jgi:glutaredoxin